MASVTLCVVIIFGFIGVGYISATSLTIVDEFAPLSLFFKFVNCDKVKDSENLKLDVSEMTVYFHDFQNNTMNVLPIKNASQSIISLKNLDKTKKFFMFVSGFNTNVNNDMAEVIRDTFRKVQNSYLIIIDHSPYTNSWGTKRIRYERAIQHVKSIGKQLAQMLVDLYKAGISAKNIHAMGHSLGGQILGHVGQHFLKATGKKIARMSALDPAGPCFAGTSIEEQIRAGVAEYVEVYHCNSGAFGTSSVLADVDFFVNNGSTQPNCMSSLYPKLLDDTMAAPCSHNFCVTMWKASVLNPDWFTAYKCDNFEDFNNGTCAQNPKTIAGFWNPGEARGKYYFSTENRDVGKVWGEG